MTMTITYIENLQKAIPETSDLWDIWPEWHGIMIWPEKTKTKTIREHPERAIKEIFTYETMTGTKTKLFIKSVTLDPPVAKGLIVIITFIGYQHKLETQKKRTCENKGQISSNWLDEAPSKVTRRRRLRVFIMIFSRFSSDYTSSFINFRCKLLLLFLSYILLWSSKVTFCINDRSEKKRQSISLHTFTFTLRGDLKFDLIWEV